MLIAEELLLIALDPVKGTVPFGVADYVKVGLSGAVLAELAIGGHLTVRHGRVVVTGPPPDEPLLVEVLAVLGADQDGLTPKAALKHVDKRLGGLWHRLVDRLVTAGAVGQEKHGPLSPTHHPVTDVARHESVLNRVRAAAAGDGPLDARDAALLALAGPCRLLERVAPDRATHAHAKARIRQATATAPFAPEVRTAIDELIAAVVAGAATAVAAGGT